MTSNRYKNKSDDENENDADDDNLSEECQGNKTRRTAAGSTSSVKKTSNYNKDNKISTIASLKINLKPNEKKQDLEKIQQASNISSLFISKEVSLLSKMFRKS